jgi:hypothetical protein
MPPFGRRTPALPEPRAPEPSPPREAPARAPSPPFVAPPPPIEPNEIDRTEDEAVERDIENWNAMRKAKKRSFREPWRSFAIAASVMFVGAPFLLPGSVSAIVDILTTGLAIASFAAGWRKR